MEIETLDLTQVKIIELKKAKWNRNHSKKRKINNGEVNNERVIIVVHSDTLSSKKEIFFFPASGHV